MPRKTTSQWEFGELFAAPAQAASPQAEASPQPSSQQPARPGPEPDDTAEPDNPPPVTRTRRRTGTPTRSNAPAVTTESVAPPSPAPETAATTPRRPASQAEADTTEGEAASEPGEIRRVFTISEITGSIRRLLEREIGLVWVTGEVTNLRLQASGHAYFTLKDATAQLSCVLFRHAASGTRKEFLQDGQKLLVHGSLSVYEPRGQYQLIVRTLEPQGLGALQVAFEKLKRKLQAEGLFAAERKRPLPRYPRRLGLVTSPTGAAIRDVLHVIERRHPALEIILAPCRVQGDGAAAEIAASIRMLNDWNGTLPAGERLDLILVTRGGGSLEDLWAFNEESVARAIFDSALPVISAVGHEIDFTISDFVADLRAATPSAAAEILTEGLFASRQLIARAGLRLAQVARSRLETARAETENLVHRLARVHPRRLLEMHQQRIDDLQGALLRHARLGLRDRLTAWTHLRQRLFQARPSALLRQRRERLEALAVRLSAGARRQSRDRASQLATAAARLRLLSPENVLARGYSVTLDAATGRIVRQAAEATPGQRLRTRLAQGEIRSTVDPADPA